MWKTDLVSFLPNVKVHLLRVFKVGMLNSRYWKDTLFFRPQAWRTHMTSANVSDDDLQTTADLSLKSIHLSERVIDNTLQGLNIDHLGALTVSVERLDCIIRRAHILAKRVMPRLGCRKRFRALDVRSSISRPKLDFGENSWRIQTNIPMR